MASFFISCRNGCGRGVRIMALPTGTDEYLCDECGIDLDQTPGYFRDAAATPEAGRAAIEAEIAVLQDRLVELDKDPETDVVSSFVPMTYESAPEVPETPVEAVPAP